MRPAAFPLSVVPNSSKSSIRTAVPSDRALPGPSNSMSPYAAALLRIQIPAESGPNPGNPLHAALTPGSAYGPTIQDSSWPRPVSNRSRRHSAPPATFTISLSGYEASALRLISCCL